MAAEIPKINPLAESVFSIENEEQFRQIAWQVYNFQFEHNDLYRQYCTLLGKSPDSGGSLEDIPFLPISFFKSHQVRSTDFEPEVVFSSSGTTGTQTSRHWVKELSLYRRSFFEGFERFFGAPQQYCIMGLLPSYLERTGSSLIYMVEALVEKSGHAASGFYLYDHEKLAATLAQLEAQKQPAILFGVSFALLDFAEKHAMPLRYVRVVETGGMKGRRKEMSKAALYETLQSAFKTPVIWSEYGMTELLSQAWAENGHYRCPPWMKVLLREETDPFSYSRGAGALNIIDLANLYSCSFIATDDRGRLHDDGSFEVSGRLDNSDVRGCSQLVL